MEIKTGSDFTGIGAFDHAVNRVCERTGHAHERVFTCDWDKYARISYTAVHGEPDYFPHDVYEREIPVEPLDIYCTTPPCQDYSGAGNRPEYSEKTILFLNSLDFIRKNKPKSFIFENVKGLLSHNKKNKKDAYGRTFREWLNSLGGLSVNGVATVFPSENSVPYHIYWIVLNSKEHGVPQNRERVFIVGFREGINCGDFQWPRTEPLTKRLKDVLETFENSHFEKESDFDEYIEKFFLSEKALKHLFSHKEKHDKKGTGFGFDLKDENSIASTLRANAALCPTDNHIKVIGNTNPSGHGMNGNVYDSEGISPILSTNKGEGVKILRKERTDQQKEERRRTSTNSFTGKKMRFIETDSMPTITTPSQDKEKIIMLDGYRVRRLTPLECSRLQDFTDESFYKMKFASKEHSEEILKKFPKHKGKRIFSDHERIERMSNSQLYKQFGNSITVRPLELITEKIVQILERNQ